MCKMQRIHCSINTLKNSIKRISELLLISGKFGNVTVCVFYVGYNSQLKRFDRVCSGAWQSSDLQLSCNTLYLLSRRLCFFLELNVIIH